MMPSFRILPLLALGAALTAHAEINRVLSYRYTADQAKELRLETFGGSIEVATVSSGDVQVELHERVDASDEAKAATLRETYKVVAVQEGQNASIVVKPQGLQSWWGSKVRVRIVAKVPEGTHLELATSGGKIEVGDLSGRLVAKTSGGPIEVGRLSGESELRTSGGSIKVKAAQARLVARTSGGGIQVGRVGDSAELRTSGGSIRVDEILGAVEAETSGGGIEAEFSTSTPRASEFRTSGGSVRVRLPKDSSCEVDLSTSGGSAEVDLPITLAEGSKNRSQLKGRLGQGGALLVLRSSGGGVSVRGR